MLLPLKQGLKLMNILKQKRDLQCCYATSIKTRIETPLHSPPCAVATQVVMLLPLKQGLKRRFFIWQTSTSPVVMLLPLKQGLKHHDGDVVVQEGMLLLCYFH